MFRSLSSHTQKQAVPTMDTIVPSPGFMNAQFATSPHSLSIYDQERSDMLNSLCAGAAVPGNLIDQSLSEEGCSLDDKYEDSTLQNFLTSEVMNTLQRTPQAALPSDFYCEGKVVPNNSAMGTGVMDSNDPTLAQLNMDTDFSFVEEILNCDSNSTLDFLCPDVKRQTPNFLTQNTNTSTACSEASRNFSGMFTVSSQITNDVQKLSREVPNGNVQSLPQRNIESNFLRNHVPMKANFPPRDTQPQIIGVVAPVIKFESSTTTPDDVKSDKLGKLQNSSPYLHKLLCKQPQSVVKSETGGTAPCNNTVTVAMVTNELPPQTVPSPSATKRTYIKLEPASGDVGPDKEESVEEKWKDIKKFMHTSEEEPLMKKRKRCDSGGSGHTSEDEIDEDDDADSMYGGKDGDDSDDDYSDIDADLAQMSPSECESLVGMGKKQKQYFWQYNVQAKGPKGTRLKLAVEAPSDPHILNGFEDPVFDECNTAVAGIRHGGKARKGDGNEVTPNPKKLFMIGHQLMRLNRQINACQLGADVPSAKRNESRKEKNKLASRACRLKKKAQHEANKIKLYGLEKEHSHLNSVLKMIWPLIKERAKSLLGQGDKLSPPAVAPASTLSLTSDLEGYIGEHLKEMIAGNTTDYVNSVILKVESGENNGGLQIKGRKT